MPLPCGYARAARARRCSSADHDRFWNATASPVLTAAVYRSAFPTRAAQTSETPLETAWLCELRGRDSNPDYLIQSQASYH